MTGPSVRTWDSAVFLDPRVETRDGHHGHAIAAALRDVLGDTTTDRAISTELRRKSSSSAPARS